jgi:hypothetical protein
VKNKDERMNTTTIAQKQEKQNCALWIGEGNKKAS